MESGEVLFLIVVAAVFAGFMGVLAYVSLTEDSTG